MSLDNLIQNIFDEALSGNRRSQSRLMSLIENQDEDSFLILQQLASKRGHATTVGITGPAGAGKSSIIDQLVKILRSENLKVGVIAVDPSSPFSGGAVLGDRVRMQRHAQDEGVFIRSIGSKGASGGISFATRSLMHAMDAFGADIVIVETVGAGQSETEIVDLVDTTVVILVPEAGDSIQALKAGMLEIADVYAINKKDRDGAEAIARDIEASLHMGAKKSFEPKVLLTEGRSGEGVQELWSEIQRHVAYLKEHGLPEAEILRRRKSEVKEWVLKTISYQLDLMLDEEFSLKDFTKTDSLLVYDWGNRLKLRLKSIL